jgi:hypothetical protein
MTKEEKEAAIGEIIGYSKEKARARSVNFYIFSALPFIAGIIWLAFSFMQVSHLEKQINIAREELITYRDSVSKEQKRLSLFKYLKESLQGDYLRFLKDNLSNKDNNYGLLLQSMRANDLLSGKFAGIKIDTSLQILYYLKGSDAERVKNSLNELGYKKIEIRVTVSDTLKAGPTNTLAYGADVPLNDAKKIALALIRTGFQIRYVYPAELNDKKTHLLQIIRTVISDGSHLTHSPLTVDQVLRARSLSDLRI